MPVNQITSKEVTSKVINKEPLFILDVRNESDFQDWKNGRRKTLNI
ncbi:hypothetical protein GCM10020331_093710 [Ectobacillus funiculus]